MAWEIIHGFSDETLKLFGGGLIISQGSSGPAKTLPETTDFSLPPAVPAPKSSGSSV